MNTEIVVTILIHGDELVLQAVLVVISPCHVGRSNNRYGHCLSRLVCSHLHLYALIKVRCPCVDGEAISLASLQLDTRCDEPVVSHGIVVVVISGIVRR